MDREDTGRGIRSEMTETISKLEEIKERHKPAKVKAALKSSPEMAVMDMWDDVEWLIARVEELESLEEEIKRLYGTQSGEPCK